MQHASLKPQDLQRTPDHTNRFEAVRQWLLGRPDRLVLLLLVVGAVLAALVLLSG